MFGIDAKVFLNVGRLVFVRGVCVVEDKESFFAFSFVFCVFSVSSCC